MKSKEILGFLTMVDLYNVLPSTLLNLKDEYTSYCFNEACSYIMLKLKNGDEPQFKKQYSSFTELYKHY